MCILLIDKMHFGKKLSLLIANSGLGHKEIARKLLISPKTISAWKKFKEPGKLPRGENLGKLADFFKVHIEYLRDDSKSYPPSNGDRLPEKPAPRERVVETEDVYAKRIPVRLRVAADGTPAVSYDTEGFPLGETGEYIERPTGLSVRAYAAEVAGDSLEPGLPHKARVIADPEGPMEWDKVRGGDIVIVKVISKDRTYIKRIEFNGDKVILISTYPVRHHPIETTREDVEILHKVVWVKMP